MRTSRLAIGLLLALGGAAEGQHAAGPAEIHHIHGLAFAARDPEILLVATHTGLVRLRPGAPPEWVGVHRFDLMGFTPHPGTPDLVFASGHPDLPTYRKEGVGNLGLLVSGDGGRTWRSVALRGEADFHTLTYSPRDGGQIYGWSVSPPTGLHRIAATTWAVTSLPARGLPGALALAASPDPAGPLLAGTKAGLMVSRDGGASWTAVGGAVAGVPVTAVAFHATDPRRAWAYALRPDLGLLASRDGGATWEAAGFVAGADTPVVALVGGPGEHVALATSRADVLRSRDGGRAWQRVVEGGRPAAGAP